MINKINLTQHIKQIKRLNIPHFSGSFAIKKDAEKCNNEQEEKTSSSLECLNSEGKYILKKSNLVSHSAAGSSPPSKCSPFQVVTQKNSLTPSAYREFFLRQNKEEQSKSKKVFFKNGIAYDHDNNKYSGFLGVVNKAGKWSLRYENGRITESFKNGKLYKKYTYSDTDVDITDKHKFADGTEIDLDQYFPFDDIQSTVIYKYDSRGLTQYTIMQNNKPEYKKEPVFNFNKFNLSTGEESQFRIIKDDGNEKMEFNSLEEAGEYFFKEYGIRAKFINLKQAHILKDTIDDFALLNYQGKGKKLFEGVTIDTGITDSDTLAWCHSDKDCTNLLFNPNCDYEDFIPHLYSVISFNSNFDWDNFEKDAFRSYVLMMHPIYKMKGYIAHELTHTLHYKNSLLNKEDIEAASEVSGYAIVSSAEFVAEYVAGRMYGKKYSKEADDLYKKCGGPDLFKDM